ncbi:lysophospholipid acyltransferase family protein [Lapidilactobacillus achengensis]|uniref:Lysophospholipid acyltransferase family protein n=1 Tax=Lapidilactobacillus achengensis TaxID=2486000 RepID=A0ABW1UPN7_9LACO|nr:lysophospholipid acyltransferase family protein [Lapidilactobacillus achengensis]
MIIGGNKQAVIDNIEQAVAEGRFNDKVEVDDPQLSPAAENQLLQDYLAALPTSKYHWKNHLGRAFMRLATNWLNRRTEVVDIANLKQISGGGIITSNHFNPLDNTAVRKAVYRGSHARLFVVSQPTNLRMTGLIGFLMNYADILPIGKSMHYMGHTFPGLLQRIFAQNDLVLIYPEQEMWFNYRRPRPLKRGSYYYAARFQVPIISLFVEMQDLGKPDNDEFNQVRYVVHVLPPIYPDPAKSIDENSQAMMAQDHNQKVAAYEQIYGQSIDAPFSAADIVGWRGAK